MSLMSSGKSYYRYTIESVADISEETFRRRRKKADHNFKSNFFFEINDCGDVEPLRTFFKLHRSAGDQILASPERLPLFESEFPETDAVIWIRTLGEFKQFKSRAPNSPASSKKILFNPTVVSELKEFAEYCLQHRDFTNAFWRFHPYNAEIEHSITVSEIVSHAERYGIKFRHLPGIEIHNEKVPKSYEMAPEDGVSFDIRWKRSSEKPAPRLSIIIPTFNNSLFLSNVIWHLLQQNYDPNNFEIIVADDGSLDQSPELLGELLAAPCDGHNITYIYWSKKHPTRGDQFFFRSGLARNLAARHAAGEYLLFLDSDMLVPPDFVENALANLATADIIQYQRYHIHQKLSRLNPQYGSIKIQTDTYIEEVNYWSQLFFAPSWASLPNYWKYTCTYALGIKKSFFMDLGMFKKYYMSYGFEDTDLGYEAFLRGARFELIKMPLLHLTAYDQMQYKNSFRKRVGLLKVTAELFFLQHLDRAIYELLGDYLRFQKPIRSFVRDLIT